MNIREVDLDRKLAQALRKEEEEEDMKTYIVYVDGVEVPRKDWVKAAGQNAAEKKAQAKFPGKNVSVSYTEV